MRNCCQLKKKKAFGLLEVLLSGVIIIIILSALMVVARNAVDNSVLLQQRAQATYLAQEGIELVRQVRDTNYIDGKETTTWDKITGIESDTIHSSNGMWNYYVSDSLLDKRLRIQRFTSGQKELSKINIDGTDYYRSIVFWSRNQYSGSSNFSPPIYYLAPTGTPSPSVGKVGYKIRVTVEWQSKNSTKKIQIETMLTNSRQGF